MSNAAGQNATQTAQNVKNVKNAGTNVRGTVKPKIASENQIDEYLKNVRFKKSKLITMPLYYISGGLLTDLIYRRPISQLSKQYELYKQQRQQESTAGAWQRDVAALTAAKQLVNDDTLKPVFGNAHKLSITASDVSKALLDSNIKEINSEINVIDSILGTATNYRLSKRAKNKLRARKRQLKHQGKSIRGSVESADKQLKRVLITKDASGLSFIERVKDQFRQFQNLAEGSEMVIEIGKDKQKVTVKKVGGEIQFLDTEGKVLKKSDVIDTIITSEAEEVAESFKQTNQYKHVVSELKHRYAYNKYTDADFEKSEKHVAGVVDKYRTKVEQSINKRVSKMEEKIANLKNTLEEIKNIKDFEKNIFYKQKQKTIESQIESLTSKVDEYKKAVKDNMEDLTMQFIKRKRLAAQLITHGVVGFATIGALQGVIKALNAEEKSAYREAIVGQYLSDRFFGQ